MKAILKIMLIIFSSSLIFSSCEGDSQNNEQPNLKDEQTDLKKEISIEPNPTKEYSLKEALASDFIEISADGNGTFRNIRVNIQNKFNTSFKLFLPAGVYFENPDENAQSLITAKKIGTTTLRGNEKLSFDIPSFCTNVTLSVPGFLKKWKYNSNYNGGLDEVIEFYGKYSKRINEWLEKKNKNFSDENKRLLFFQTVIWYHEGGQYKQILTMLKNDIFKNDIEEAKVWLDDIQQEASELSQLIKERNSKKIKSWLKEKIIEIIPTSEQINSTVEKGTKKLYKFGERFKSN